MLVTDYLEPNKEEKDNKEDKEQEKKDGSFRKNYVMFTQFILEEVVFIGLAIFLGLYLDKKLNTKFVFLLVLILVLGFVPLYNLLKRLKS